MKILRFISLFISYLVTQGQVKKFSGGISDDCNHSKHSKIKPPSQVMRGALRTGLYEQNFLRAFVC